MEAAGLGLPLAALITGLLLGFLAAWVVRLRPLEMALVEARARTGELERRAGEAEDARRRCEEEARGLREEVRRLDAEKREVEGTLEAERRAHAARIEELRETGRQLEEKFAALADEVLGRNSAKFLELVSERFRTHSTEAERSLEARKREIEELIRPVREALEKFEHRVGEIEKAREGAYRAVSEQVRLLAESHQRLERYTASLVQALRRPQVRGRWGEYQLRNVVELAGMSEHVDYVLQAAQEGGDGRLRPDAVIRLPGGKTVVVDAKTPLDAYLTAVEAQSEEERRAALDHHARQLRAHVQMLASKEYWRQFSDAPDFVVMFVPGEAFYAAAVERDPTLFEYALERRVLITTPSTFVALMKAIAFGWQQEKIAESARQVAEAARELYNRIGTFLDHMNRLGRALSSAVDHYNRAVGSLESRVLPQARRFAELGVTPAGERLPEAGSIERVPRQLHAPELPDGAEAAPADAAGTGGNAS